MTALELPALAGHSPLGFLAALGAFDVVTRAQDEAGLRQSRLAWTGGLRPHAVLSDAPDLDGVLDLVVADQERWGTSPVLAPHLETGVPDDIKPAPDVLHRWCELVVGDGSPTDARLLAALLAEGPLAGTGDAKPTTLHFTAGQQRFLRMVRQLRDEVTRDDLQEALVGPWRFASKLPSLGWDARGQRVYAVSGFKPAQKKRLSVPGAEWLAFLGLRFFPVSAHGDRLLTTGCAGSWKDGSFSWPLWEGVLPASVVASLVATRDLPALPKSWQEARGVTEVVIAVIRRTEQGGYGSFAPPATAGGRAGDPLLKSAASRSRRQP